MTRAETSTLFGIPVSTLNMDYNVNYTISSVDELDRTPISLVVFLLTFILG